MSACLPTHLRPRGVWNLVVLCLISGVLAQQANAQDAPRPDPDVVVFKNGDQLTGTLVRGVGDSVIFKSDIVGEVTIPLNQVKELRSSGNFAVLKKGEKINRASVQPGSITSTDSSVIVSHQGGTTETRAGQRHLLHRR